MAKLLTDRQLSDYRTDGFISPVTIMSPSEARILCDRFEAVEARWPDAFSGVGRNNAHLAFTCLDEIVHHPRILDAVEDLIGPDILVSASVLFVKDPGDPGFVSWHQDATYMGLEPHTGVTAWLALSPSNRQSGCMRMIPGSHRQEIKPHIDTFAESNILTRGQEVPDVDDSQAVDLVLEPGQISLHHMRTIHGSQPNQSRHRRIGFAIQSYIEPRVKQTLGTTYAQLARGQDPCGNFPFAPRPDRDMAPEAVEFRRRVNQLSSDILYRGARRRRDY